MNCKTMDRDELETHIIHLPLSPGTLLYPDNLFFLLSGFCKALALLLQLPFLKVERLFPPAAERREYRVDIEQAAIAFTLTEKVLRSHLLPWRRTCLRRSILLANLLRRSGLEVHICFGVSSEKKDLRGHSWLTYKGEPFLETDGEREDYTCVFTLPRKAD